MEEFFTKVPNYSIEKCEKPFPLLIDFDLKHCIKTETFKNLTSGRSKRNIPLPILKNEPMGRIDEYTYKSSMWANLQP